MKILIADDEQPLINFLLRGLRAEGYECASLNALHEVLPYVKKHSPPVIVLDRLFGSEDSLSIIEALKALPSPPMILMLTALDDISERVKGLQTGADDYLCKPFDFDEFLARVTALKRLSEKLHRLVAQQSSLRLGGLEIRQDERIALLNSIEISLTKIEFEMLLYLTDNQKKVLSRERILSRVWQSHSNPQTNIVDVYISRLRRKLDSDPSITIQTLRGNGYRFSPTDQG